jgi:hypothetical protein
MRTAVADSPFAVWTSHSRAVISHSEALSRLTVGDTRSDMINWLLCRAIDKVEREWNCDASQIRDTIDASPRAA